ncbi:hypothetical protein [Candidatus Chloroploca sp. Khr17]|uniref:hypothetical protein n=1 Tax=Candidatus Chloroploca sp. Khr17 TaxID=2496869 RepID=UPI00101D3A6E|nr:hypothetical protein [Candidatus Chloroploca sp. Khr17]
MDTTIADQLAQRLSQEHALICQRVATRMLDRFPELQRSLRLEENYSPIERLAEVAVERLNELVRSVLLFDLPSLADNELAWASGVLPRRGVTFEHQDAMVRWFFEEVRQLSLNEAEQAIIITTEQHFLRALYHAYGKELQEQS